MPSGKPLNSRDNSRLPCATPQERFAEENVDDEGNTVRRPRRCISLDVTVQRAAQYNKLLFPPQDTHNGKKIFVFFLVLNNGLVLLSLAFLLCGRDNKVEVGSQHANDVLMVLLCGELYCCLLALEEKERGS